MFDTDSMRRSRVAQVVQVLLELAVAALVGFERDEQGRGVAEVVIGHQGHDPRRELRLERGQAVFDLRPYLVLVANVVLQFDQDVAHAVHRGRSGLGPLDLLVGHQELLEGTGQLLLDLLARRPGIDPHDDTLTDRELGKLLLGNMDQSEDSEQEQAPDDQEGDTEVPASPMR